MGHQAGGFAQVGGTRVYMFALFGDVLGGAVGIFGGDGYDSYCSEDENMWGMGHSFRAGFKEKVCPFLPPCVMRLSPKSVVSRAPAACAVGGCDPP